MDPSVRNSVGVSLNVKDWTLEGYRRVFQDPNIWRGFRNSFFYSIAFTIISVTVTLLTAYPMSRNDFMGKKFFNAIFVFTMFFGGGLMPTYYIVSKTKLIDTVWALIIPGAVPIFNCIVLMNFFRGIPSELEESAKLDGASQWQILWRIFIPISKPSLATIILFSLINHWNSWFDGLIYSNHTTNYPLQSYLQTLVTSTTEILAQGDVKAIARLVDINDTNMKAAQIFISVIPLMLIYPFLQKYFTTGLTMGSVKG